MTGFRRIALLQRDPTLVVLAFALWSLFSGASLLGPGEIFLVNPPYRPLARLGWPEEVWGVTMLADAALLGWTTLWTGLLARSAAAALSGGFWLYFGAHVLAGGFEAGFISVIGCWEVCAGLGLLAATVQWAGYYGGPGGE